jgi:hypothetical protein
MSEDMVMKVFIIRARDELLKDAFQMFDAIAKKVATQGLSFSDRVKLIENIHEQQGKIAQMIRSLYQKGEVHIEEVPASLFDEISDPVLKYQLMNGLYKEHEIATFMSNPHVPEALQKRFLNHVHQMMENEYILCWNVGELEADAILSD